MSHTEDARTAFFLEEIIERLDMLVEKGRLSDFDRTTLLETAYNVIREIKNRVKSTGSSIAMIGPEEQA